MSTNVYQRALTASGALMSRPSAFLVVVAYAALWLIFSRETFDWHAVVALVTWAMTLFIQRAEHRDTQAIHAKLDELLHAQGATTEEFTRLDDREPEEIEAKREDERTNRQSN